MKPLSRCVRSAVARTPEDIGSVLGLKPGEIALMKYKAELSSLAVRALRDSALTVAEIVQRSGVARSKVSAVKNGATVSVSCDLLIKIIGAAGVRVRPHAA